MTTTEAPRGQFSNVLPDGVGVRPTGQGMGAEITGIDLSGAVEERTVQIVRDTILRYGLVVLRGQGLSLETQVDFTRRLYPLRPAAKKVNAYAPAGRPEMQIISNIVEDGRRVGFGDAGLWWHSDQSFTRNPELFVGLHAIQLPRRDGVVLGDTHYVSTTAAYDTLPAATKDRVADLRAVHSYVLMIERLIELGKLTRPPKTEEQGDELPDIEQPVVRTHAVTGRKILYVNESFTRRIVGVPAEEGEALLQELFAHLLEPQHRYTHRWEDGDYVIWDNSATQHLATFDYGEIPRRMHRCGTDGPYTE